jgi:cobalt-zinc-cadmium efflux system outer membrane protein
MRRCRFFAVLGILFALTVPRSLLAQLVVIDDVILMTSRQKQKEQARTHQHLDPPGGENLLSPSPGADEPLLGEEPVRTSVLRRLLATGGMRRGQRRGGNRLSPRSPVEPQTEDIPLAGPLELPMEDDGPPDGLTLEACIDRLLACNRDLAARFQDIPKARADILTASLRSNPFLFVSVSNIPYGSYSPERPGATTYDLTVIQPIDLNGKRQARVRVAEQAKHVLEAQYQDAVRLEIARFYFAFTNVLRARDTLRACQAGLERVNAFAETVQDLASRGRRPQDDVTQVMLQRADGELAARQAEAGLIQARHELAVLLAFPAEQADSIRLHGSLLDHAPPPPCTEKLIEAALQSRPDLAAYRLGTDRAVADLERQRAEALDNVFLFYTPFTATDFAPQDKQSASGWGLGVLLPVPLFDRNQGDIARARLNVNQTQLERQGVERRVVNEVQFAAAEYAASRRALEEYEHEILAAARNLRDEMRGRYVRGEEDFSAFQEVQNEYHDILRAYLEGRLRHRRDMLRLNTAVGQRLLP